LRKRKNQKNDGSHDKTLVKLSKRRRMSKRNGSRYRIEVRMKLNTNFSGKKPNISAFLIGIKKNENDERSINCLTWKLEK
jgi:hypothetical protein